ncbi:MAG: hypothetical protein IJ758_00825 [Clostridia bacterium]|nr:hypothetical protein [Clostridia bacterium]
MKIKKIVAFIMIITAVLPFVSCKKSEEINSEDATITQTQETTPEENEPTENCPPENNSNEKNQKTKTEDKKSNNAKNAEKTNSENNAPNIKEEAPEVKTELKVEDNQVTLNEESEIGSSKIILNFDGDRLLNVLFELTSKTDQSIPVEFQKSLEEMGIYHTVNFDGKNLKMEITKSLIDEINKSGMKKQDIVDFFKNNN